MYNYGVIYRFLIVLKIRGVTDWYQSVRCIFGDNQYSSSDGPSAADPHPMLFGIDIVIGYAVRVGM
jgi:hypothetical protein